jgi:hypothetical protein
VILCGRHLWLPESRQEILSADLGSVTQLALCVYELYPIFMSEHGHHHGRKKRKVSLHGAGLQCGPTTEAALALLLPHIWRRKQALCAHVDAEEPLAVDVFDLADFGTLGKEKLVLDAVLRIP